MLSRSLRMDFRSGSGSEAERLAALARSRMMDTSPEERFDRLARVAAMVLEAPIALVTLVDADRQWFKARVGLAMSETPRTLSFCAHALDRCQPGPFVVSDARTDARFASNPLVTGEPGIRFYAGQVVRDSNGFELGTLCVIDRVPRTWSDTQSMLLAELAQLVETEFRHNDERRVQSELVRSDQHRALIVETIDEGLVLHDADGRIVQWNPAAERVLGLTGDELAGRTSIDPRWAATHVDGRAWPGETHPAMVALATNEPVVGQLMGVHRPDRTRVWLRVTANPVRDPDGVTTGVLAVFTDVTAERHERELLDLTLDAAPVGLAIIDERHRIIRCNATFAGHTGHPIGTLTGADFALALPAGCAILTGPDGTSPDGSVTEHRLVRPDGTTVMVALRVRTVAAPGCLAIVATADITREHHDRTVLDTVLETAPVGIAIMDEHRHILRCNTAYTKHTGRAMEDLVGIDPVTLLHPDDQPAAMARRRSVLSGYRADPAIDVRVQQPDGTERVATIHTRLIAAPAPLVVAVNIDITERVALTRILAHQASHDPLTDLANRARFETEVARALARTERDGHRIAVAYIDLDRFKAVNDNHGHTQGDRVLIAVAGSLTNTVRSGDLAARLGGDEFAVLLDPVTGPDDACVIASRMRDAIIGADTRIGASVGVTLNQAHDTALTILARADHAQYQAKSRADSIVHLTS